MARRYISRGSNGMIPLMLFQAVNEYRRRDHKPPVTAALLAANTLIYLRPAFLHPLIPSIDDVWFNAHLILKYKDLKRFFLSAFYHLGESHLAYNMMSLLWKGIQLESSMKSTEFASMIAILLSLSQGITLSLAKSLLLFNYEKPYYHEYAVGFSGVLFAMKVVLNSQSESYTNVHGFMVRTKHAAWAELILIQMLVPGVSFLGHLGGILAGIVYLQLKGKGVTDFLGWPFRFVMSFWRARQPPGVSGSGQTGQTGGSESESGSGPGLWRCRACTFDNPGWLTVCEVCGDGGVSLLQTDSVIRLNEIRQRRVERFGR